MTPIKLLLIQTEPKFPFWKNRLYVPIIGGRLQTSQKHDLKKADLIKFNRPQVIAVFGYFVGSYAETAYSAQSEIYDQVYELAGLSSGLVNGQHYRPVFIRARFWVKLWMHDVATSAAALPGPDDPNRQSARARVVRAMTPPIALGPTLGSKVARLDGRPHNQVGLWLRFDLLHAETARWLFLAALRRTHDLWSAAGVYHCPSNWQQAAPGRRCPSE